MSRFRSFSALGAVALSAAVIAGCGGGSSSNAAVPSALDPASRAPSDSVLYFSADIQPQGSLKSNLVNTINYFGGAGTAQRLTDELEGKVGEQDASKWKQLKSWLGQRVGIAVLPPPVGPVTEQTFENSFVVIAPTSDPSAAQSFLKSNIPISAAITWKVSGNYVVLGSAVGVQAALSTTDSNSLAASGAYQSATKGITSSSLATVYARAKPLVQLIKGATQTNSLPADEKQKLDQELRQISPDASLTADIGVTANTVSLAYSTYGLKASTKSPSEPPSSVASLPASSWLALDLSGSLANPKVVSGVQSQYATLLNRLTALQPSAQPAVRFLSQDLLPALGPISLSVAGSTESTLRVGVVITPDNAAAGPKLVTGLRQLLAKSHVPVAVGTSGAKVVAVYGYAKLAQLLSPSSTLGDSAVYKQALTQLPAGSSVPFFLNFGPIADILSADKNPSDAQVAPVVGKLKYLIIGGNKTAGRIVLGLN